MPSVTSEPSSSPHGTTERQRGERWSAIASARMTTSATSCAVYAAPSRLRTSRMCRSSRESNAVDPSGSVARSSSAIPSLPGRIECRPVQREAAPLGV